MKGDDKDERMMSVNVVLNVRLCLSHANRDVGQITHDTPPPRSVIVFFGLSQVVSVFLELFDSHSWRRAHRVTQQLRVWSQS